MSEILTSVDFRLSITNQIPQNLVFRHIFLCLKSNQTFLFRFQTRFHFRHLLWIQNLLDNDKGSNSKLLENVTSFHVKHFYVSLTFPLGLGLSRLLFWMRAQIDLFLEGAIPWQLWLLKSSELQPENSKGSTRKDSDLRSITRGGPSANMMINCEEFLSGCDESVSDFNASSWSCLMPIMFEPPRFLNSFLRSLIPVWSGVSWSFRSTKKRKKLVSKKISFGD